MIDDSPMKRLFSEYAQVMLKFPSIPKLTPKKENRASKISVDSVVVPLMFDTKARRRPVTFGTEN